MSESPYPPPLTESDTNSSSLRLISCNLQFGTPSEGWDKNERKLSLRGFTPTLHQARMSLITAAQEIRSLNPDILLVQEVDMYQARSGNLNQVAYVAAVLGMDYWEYAPIFSGHIVGLHHNPRSVLARGKHGYGLALFSRFPIRRSLSLSLPGYKSLPDVFPSFTKQGTILQGAQTYSRSVAQYCRGLIKDQPRIVQGALIETPLGNLVVGNTHLDLNADVAGRQVRLAWKSLHDLDADAYALAGDFNLSPQAVDESLELLPDDQRPSSHYCATSFPAREPRYQIDQLLVDGVQVHNGPHTQRLSISDHLSVIYDLTLPTLRH